MNMRTLLHFNDNETNINLWIDNGANPFHIACENGHDNTVQFSLDNGADINVCKIKWARPCLIGCQEGQYGIVQH